MSRRRSSANNGGGGGGDEPSEIRGPTSALTQFLKDQGIRSRPRNPFQRRVSEAEAAAAAAGPSGTSSPAPSTSASGALTPGGISNIAEDDNDEADDDDDLPSASAGPSFPGTPASERDEGDVYAQASTSRTTIEITTTTVSSATKKRKAPAAADKKKGKGKKKKKGEGDEDDDDDYDDGEFELQVTGTPKSRYGDRKPGSFAMCAECNKKFTITRYTNAHPDLAGGVLCGPCDKEIGPASGQVQGGKAAGSGGAGAAAKKRARAVKNKTVLNKEKPSVMSLTKCCIEIIGKAIQDVEEFGDIGGVNRDKVCQIVCKNRDLTMETLQLFLDVENTSLTLYDCARLEPEALRTVANHCPNLEILRLYMCGFLDGPTVLHFANRLTKLKQLELYAAFLVRKEHWHDFFDVLAREKRGPAFEGFLIRQTPRIDNGVLGKLVETCANLTHLQLAECGALDDSSLAVLGGLKKLRHLDLSHGGLKGESFTDDGMVPLLEAVGRTLHALILDENVLLTDRTLIEGVKVNCTELIELSLRNVGELLPTGVAELFAPDWVNQRGMVRVNLARCHQLDDQAIEAVLRHSGTSLLKLDLNSVDGLTAELGLKLLAESCPNLTELDVSFVREVDDFVLKNLLDRLPAIQRIYIYGNNRISDSCPQKAGVKVLGHEQGVVNFD